MTIFLNDTGQGIFIQAVAEGPGLLGDATRLLLPGETFFGLSFAEVKALGDGEHDITPAAGYSEE